MNIELELRNATRKRRPAGLLDVGDACDGIACAWRPEGEKALRKFTLVVDERSTILGHLEAALTIAGRELQAAA